MYRMVPGSTDKMMAQMRRGAIEHCVLALLRDQDLYGLELTRKLTEADGLVTSEGTVYPLLSRLHREGLVEATWEESPAGPPRRYYRITKEGRAALKAFIGQWQRFRTTVDTLLDSGGTRWPKATPSARPTSGASRPR
jgi:PadR family transcriptional regulator PadR